jgi:hypothetical protein
MYPINWYVDTHPEFPTINSLRLHMQEKLWNKALDLNEGAFRQRLRTLHRLRLNQYRKSGFEINWVYFGKKGNLEIPDTETHSEIFTAYPQDKKISTGLTYEDLRGKIYPEPMEIIKKIGNPEYLVVGGFHKNDCVSRIACAPKSEIDDCLTEDFFYSVFNTFGFDLDAKLIRSGHLDAEMHEDNPKKEKRKVLESLLKENLKL